MARFAVFLALSAAWAFAAVSQPFDALSFLKGEWKGHLKVNLEALPDDAVDGTVSVKSIMGGQGLRFEGRATSDRPLFAEATMTYDEDKSVFRCVVVFSNAPFTWLGEGKVRDGKLVMNMTCSDEPALKIRVTAKRANDGADVSFDFTDKSGREVRLADLTFRKP